jgi:hypothetical protein
MTKEEADFLFGNGTLDELDAIIEQLGDTIERLENDITERGLRQWN